MASLPGGLSLNALKGRPLRQAQGRSAHKGFGPLPHGDATPDTGMWPWLSHLPWLISELGVGVGAGAWEGLSGRRRELFSVVDPETAGDLIVFGGREMLLSRVRSRLEQDNWS